VSQRSIIPSRLHFAAPLKAPLPHAAVTGVSTESREVRTAAASSRLSPAPRRFSIAPRLPLRVFSTRAAPAREPPLAVPPPLLLLLLPLPSPPPSTPPPPPHGPTPLPVLLRASTALYLDMARAARGRGAGIRAPGQGAILRRSRNYPTTLQPHPPPSLAVAPPPWSTRAVSFRRRSARTRGLEFITRMLLCFEIAAQCGDHRCDATEEPPCSATVHSNNTGSKA
jgi:hypothetical protein